MTTAPQWTAFAVVLPVAGVLAASLLVRWLAERPRALLAGVVAAALAAGGTVTTGAHLAVGDVVAQLAATTVEVPPPTTVAPSTTVVDRDGELVDDLGTTTVEPLADVTALPDHVVGAFLAAEDADFARHGGVDLRGIARAALNNTTSGQRQGGSTITQQLAKLTVVGDAPTLGRKLRELAVAGALESSLTKDELLTAWLDRVYLGDGQQGLGAGARHWFGVAPQELTVAQAATLAAIVPAPSVLDPRTAPELVRPRRERVLALMVETGVITAQQAGRAARQPLRTTPPSTRWQDGHALRLARQDLDDLVRDATVGPALAEVLAAGGATVHTSLDGALQDELRGAAAGWTPHSLAAGAVVLDTDTGGVRALLGDASGVRAFDPTTRGRRDAVDLLAAMGPTPTTWSWLGVEDGATTNALELAGATTGLVTGRAGLPTHVVTSVVAADGRVVWERPSPDVTRHGSLPGRIAAEELRGERWAVAGDSRNRGDQWVVWRDGGSLGVSWSGLPECSVPVEAVRAHVRSPGAVSEAETLALALGAPLTDRDEPTPRRLDPVDGRPDAAALAHGLGAVLDDIEATELSVLVEVDGLGTVLDRGGDLLLPPASTTKLFTAAQVLADRGATGRFTTTVHATSTPVDGVLRGDLVVRGDWDPTITPRDVHALAARVREAGIERVEGRLLLHQPTDQDLGGAAELVPTSFAPFTPFAVDGHRWTCGVADVPGAVRASTRLLRDALAGAGVRVTGGSGSTATAPVGGVVAAHRSAPVATVARQALFESNNLAAEQLHQSAPATPGTGMDPWGASLLHDGTGLDDDNLLAARDLVALLRRAATAPWGPELLAAMPRPCHQGTLRERLCEEGLADAVRAKTGTLDDAVALAGVVETSWGATARFAILVHEPTDILRTRRLQDEFVRVLHDGRSAVRRTVTATGRTAHLTIDGPVDDVAAVAALLREHGATAAISDPTSDGDELPSDVLEPVGRTAALAGRPLDEQRAVLCGTPRSPSGLVRVGGLAVDELTTALVARCDHDAVLGWSAIVQDGELAVAEPRPLAPGDVVLVPASPTLLDDLELALQLLRDRGLVAVPLPTGTPDLPAPAVGTWRTAETEVRVAPPG